MSDRQYVPLGQGSAPAGWTLPTGLQINPKLCYASFDGTGAAGAFRPTLRLISDSGHVAGEYASDTSVAAGASADTSWFRGLAAGGGGGAGVGVAASAYLYTDTTKTFTGNVGFSATWDHFSTTNASVFGTNPFGTFTLPPNNMPGDVNLMLLQTGAYIAEATAVWAAGQSRVFGEIQMGHVDYQDDGRPTNIGDLVGTVAPMSNEGDLMTQSVRLLTLPQTWAPSSIYFLCEGQTATTYTLTHYRMVVHWLGSGIGADDQVY